MITPKLIEIMEKFTGECPQCGNDAEFEDIEGLDYDIVCGVCGWKMRTRDNKNAGNNTANRPAV